MLSLLLISFLVMRTSSAVFSDTTENDGNNITADTVTLSDNDEGVALFAVDGVVPNDVLTRCIEVTYDGSATGADLTEVKLYSNSDYNVTSTASGDFDAQLDLVVNMGDSDDTCDVDGADGWTEKTSSDTIETFSGAHSDFSNGMVTGWTPAGTPETRAFQFVVTFKGTAGNDFQGAVLGTVTPLKFTWEIQSGSGSAK